MIIFLKVNYDLMIIFLMNDDAFYYCLVVKILSLIGSLVFIFISTFIW